ncbi:MAG: tetratricopeptide repeat protein [Bacteroidales bacterium]|nr:tetratricopeptide repeat protein [Bacteroidales bacterium]
MKKSSLNKFYKTLFPLVVIAFITAMAPLNTFSQVFPEVSTPEASKKQQEQEKEKLAFQYYGNKEYEKALELFRDLYGIQPTYHRYTYYFYCMTYLNLFDEAEKVVKGRMKAEPESYRYQVDLGYLYLLTDKPDKATKVFDELLAGMKPTKAAVNELANAFVMRQLYDYTIKVYLKGREILGYTEMFHQDLARIYEVSGNYSGMIEEYLDLLQADPMQLETVQNRLQNALNKDIDDKISNLLRESLLRRNQRNPDNRNYGEMLLWLSVQQKDFEFALIQARSLDTRFNEGGFLVLEVGDLALSNKEYDVAIEAFSYITRKGQMHPLYAECLTGSLQARFLRLTEGYGSGEDNLEDLEKEYLTAVELLGKNARTLILMRDLAHLQAFYLNKLDDAVALLEEILSIPNAPDLVKADIKLELGDIYLFVGEVWEASLLYSQVEKMFKNDPKGHEAKFRNARLSYYIGEFEWAKAQLDVLKAATSKLIANDAMDLSLLIGDNMDADSTYTTLACFARADLLKYRNQDSLAVITLDSIAMMGLYNPLDDEVLFSKAEIFIRQKKFDLADSLLATLVKVYSRDILADNALFKRAEMQAEVFGNDPLALELYQQLMLDYPGSLFATEARKRFRQLRGDFNN